MASNSAPFSAVCASLADIPVIVITAVGIRPEIAADLDLVHAFSKPLDRPRLLAAIRRYCAPKVS